MSKEILERAEEDCYESADGKHAGSDFFKMDGKCQACGLTKEDCFNRELERLPL